MLIICIGIYRGAWECIGWNKKERKEHERNNNCFQHFVRQKLYPLIKCEYPLKWTSIERGIGDWNLDSVWWC